MHITSKDSKGLLSSCFFFNQNSFIRRPIASQICKQLSIINSLKWIVFPSNCIQLHKCFYCSPPPSVVFMSCHMRKERTTVFINLEMWLLSQDSNHLFSFKTLCLSNLDCMSLEPWLRILHAWYSGRSLRIKQIIFITIACRGRSTIIEGHLDISGKSSLIKMCVCMCVHNCESFYFLRVPVPVWRGNQLYHEC